MVASARSRPQYKSRSWNRYAVLNRSGSTILGGYVGLMVIWLIFPIAVIILASLQGSLDISLSPADINLDAYAAIPETYWESFWFTIKVSVTATVCALVIAVPAGWALVRGKLRERRLVSNLVLIPDVVPQLMLGIALLTLYIPLRLNNSFAGILLALIGLSLALALRFAEALIEGVPEEYELAALTLGASRLTVFRVITLPLIAPGVVIAALFIFMSNLITFVLLFFIAGPNSMPIAIRLFVDIVDRGVLPYAVAMAAVLVYVALAFYAIVAFTLGPKYLTGAVMSRKG